MKKLDEKKILLIAPTFFGYEKKIADKMIELGAQVDFFDERSIRSSFEKAVLKINPDFFYKKTTIYYNKIIEEIGHIQYDYILIIKCEMMSVETIKKIKKIFSESILCLYLYDSFSNIKGIEKKISYFDRVLSFDEEDSDKYSNIIFRPLFFSDEFKRKKTLSNKYEFNISFIGTIHSDRYKIINSIKELAQKKDYECYFYCYLQSKLAYYYYKIIKPEFKNTNVKDFEFKKISSLDIARIINKTEVVLDIQHPKQSGLTMRTIEMIGMQKKMITTNKNIKRYDFYNANNIAVIERDNIKLPVDFFDKPYQLISEEIYLKYSLESWVIDVLGV